MLATPVVAQPTQPQALGLLPTSFIPKSPTLTPFQRFDTQELVNLPTGAAQLSIPLTDISCGSLRLPVSLAYSFTGLQVYQPWDLVGLGWSLQAGTSISRQVNGLLDEAATSPWDRYNADTIARASQAFLRRAMLREADTGPDVYSFTLPTGLSGRFILRDTLAILLPQQPVYIRLLRSGQGGFQVTTEEGIRYQFQAPEQTHNNGESGLGSYTSAWHLTQVISATNADTLRLHYSPNSEGTPKRTAITTEHYISSYFYNDVYSNPGIGDMNACTPGTYTYQNIYARATTLQTQYLDSISGRGGRIVFRRDPSTHVLQKVSLLATNGRRQEIKSVSLRQSKFDGVGEGRLRLDAVQESANGLSLPAYRFHYREGYMPSRASAAQDYWGYYNGATRNGGDAENPFGPALLADPRLGAFAANRKPEVESALMGALLQVTYPTGGRSQWEYELGRVWPESGKGITIPTTYRDTLGVDVQTQWDPYNNRRAPAYSPTYPSSRVVTYSDTLKFILSEPGTIRVTVARETQNGDPDLKNQYRDFDIWQIKPEGGFTRITSLETENSYVMQNGLRRFKFSLPPGRYVAQAYSENLEVSSLTILVPFSAPVTGADLEGGKPGGGIRVKRTRTVASGSPALVRTYTYVVPDPAGSYGSGVTLAGGQLFGEEEFRDIYANDSPCTGYNQTSDNSQPGDEFKKYSFYYSCVSVRDSIQAGATVNYYTHLDYQFNDVVLVQKQVYRQAPQQPLQLSQEDTYSYGKDSVTAFPLTRPRYIQRVVSAVGNTQKDIYGSQSYWLQAAQTVPRITAQTRYDEQGRSLVTTTYSTYQQQRLVRSASRTSKGWQIQRYKRLGDYASTPAIQALRVNHFNPVVEKQEWQRPSVGSDSSLVGGQLTFFEPSRRQPAGSWSLRLPRPVSSPDREQRSAGGYRGFKSDSRYRPIDSLRYDPVTGLVQERQVPRGQCTSYVWGYDRSQVVAQIDNATFAQVRAVLGQPTLDRLLSKSPGDEQQVRQLLSPLRTSLPQARVTTYTYRPLVGVTSVTDPSGRTMYYEYDALGRLLRVRDEQGHVLTEQLYHYSARP